MRPYQGAHFPASADELGRWIGILDHSAGFVLGFFPHASGSE
jgi:hypothetical protein